MTESNFPVKLNQINPLPPQRQLVALSDTSITGHLHFSETALGGQPIWDIFEEEYKLKMKSPILRFVLVELITWGVCEVALNDTSKTKERKIMFYLLSMFDVGV